MFNKNVGNILISVTTILAIFVAVFAVTYNYTYAVADGYGDGGCCGGEYGGGGDYPGGETPQPAVCSYFSVSPKSLPAGGGNVTITWQTSNATSVSIDNGVGSVSANGSKTVHVSGNTTFRLTAVGTGGNDTHCVGTVSVSQPVAPVCNYLHASPSTLPNGGGNVTLSWSTTGGTGVTLWGVGDATNSGTTPNISLSGSKTVFVNKTKSFTLDVWNSAGQTDQCATSVTVQPPVQNPPAKCDLFTVSPSNLPNGGGYVTLTWQTTNASSVSIDNGVGSVSADGSKSVYVSNNTTFHLSANGTGGNDNHCQASVTVNTSNPPAKCEYFTADKTVINPNGEYVTLSWNTSNATSVSINNGIGSVSNSGSRSVFVNGNTTFILTANGTGGNDDCSVSISTEVITGETPRCDYFRIAGNDDVEEGDEIILEWATTNADDVRIEPTLGHVSNDGSEEVTVYDDETYTLHARNLSSGQEATCSTSVHIEDTEDNNPSPRCDLNVSRDRVNPGEKVTLSWDTNHADDIRIRDDHGNTIFDTDDYSSRDRKRYLDGEIDVVVYNTTEFTLNAHGDGGSRTCRVTVKTDNLPVYEKRDQGMVIALTQVPYTGFEAGPFLAFLFYGILTLWALFIAYILVIKKGSIMGFSLYGKNAAGASHDLEQRKKVEALVTKYSGRLWK